jgi:hypothetical protein
MEHSDRNVPLGAGLASSSAAQHPRPQTPNVGGTAGGLPLSTVVAPFHFQKHSSNRGNVLDERKERPRERDQLRPLFAAAPVRGVRATDDCPKIILMCRSDNRLSPIPHIRKARWLADNPNWRTVRRYCFRNRLHSSCSDLWSGRGTRTVVRPTRRQAAVRDSNVPKFSRLKAPLLERSIARSMEHLVSVAYNA